MTARPSRLRAIPALLLLLSPAALAGQAPPATRPGWTPADWYTLKTAEWPTISPDGGTVVYRVYEPDVGGQNRARLWAVSTSTGVRRELTTGNEPSWAPAFSPDGRRVAYLSAQKGGTQVFLVDVRGGPALQLTSASNSVDGFKWSPDGRSIAFVSGEPVPRPDSAGVSQSRVFRVMDRGNWYSASIWVVPVPAPGASQVPAAERITDAKDFAADDALTWSPDSRRIAFPAFDYASKESFWTYDLYVVTLADRTVKKLVSDKGPQFWPVWSPDGREIAFRTYVTAPHEDYYTWSAGYVATVPAEGGPVRILTEEFDENPTPIAWGPDGIYFVARERNYSHLFRVAPASGVFTRVSEPANGLKTNFSFSRDFRTVAFLGQDSVRWPEVYVAPITGTAQPRRLTEMGKQLDGWPIGSRELVHWTSTDGTPIEGILIKPPGFDPRRKYPLLVVPHTGPLEADQLTLTKDFPYTADLYAMRGILVLKPNYRGSIGYGRRFRAALMRNQGLPQYLDVITGVDHLVAQGFVDSSRVGAAGWSAAGYIVAFGAVWGNRFRAASVLETGANWQLFHVLGAGGGVRPDYAQALPWDDPDYYRMTSVVTYIKRAKTPMLIQHGDADRTAPIEAAYELHRALKDQGVPVRMVVFPGMGHVPNSLAQVKAIQEQNLEWFERYLLGKP